MCCQKSLYILFCVVIIAIAVSIAVSANFCFAEPYVDIGFKGLDSTDFTQANAEGDQDLIIVRERFYGAEGIDLSEYGLNSSIYIQSILFRPRPGAEVYGQYKSTVTFIKQKSTVLLLVLSMMGQIQY